MQSWFVRQKSRFIIGEIWAEMLNLFRHKKQYQIQVNRDSVCMGDDCDIHEVTMALPENMRLSQLLQWLADYVPPMKNVIWAIQSEKVKKANS